MAHDDDGHVSTALGLYFLGGLSAEDHAAIEAHLARCGSCLAEYYDTATVTVHLRTLCEDDAADLMVPDDVAVSSYSVRPTP